MPTPHHSCLCSCKYHVNNNYSNISQAPTARPPCGATQPTAPRAAATAITAPPRGTQPGTSCTPPFGTALTASRTHHNESPDARSRCTRTLHVERPPRPRRPCASARAPTTHPTRRRPPSAALATIHPCLPPRPPTAAWEPYPDYRSPPRRPSVACRACTLRGLSTRTLGCSHGMYLVVLTVAIVICMHRMALQLLNGNSLADLLGHELTRDDFAVYAHRMLGCVRTLHEAGWVHRDIKPAQFCMGLGAERSKVLLVVVFQEKPHQPCRYTWWTWALPSPWTPPSRVRAWHLAVPIATGPRPRCGAQRPAVGTTSRAWCGAFWSCGGGSCRGCARPS